MAEGLPAARSDDRRRPDPRPTFLLIDDDTLVGRTIAHAAEAFGYRPLRTTSIDRFSASLESERPDIVAVDLCVPGRDGIEIIRFLAERGFRGPVVIISGLDSRVVEAALRLGRALGLSMAEPIAKPFRLADLADRLGREEPLVPA